MLAEGSIWVDDNSPNGSTSPIDGYAAEAFVMVDGCEEDERPSASQVVGVARTLSGLEIFVDGFDDSGADGTRPDVEIVVVDSDTEVDGSPPSSEEPRGGNRMQLCGLANTPPATGDMRIVVERPLAKRGRRKRKRAPWTSRRRKKLTTVNERSKFLPKTDDKVRAIVTKNDR